MEEEVRDWLAEVTAAFGEDGSKPLRFATGVPITRRHLLTAAHVLEYEKKAPTAIHVRFPRQNREASYSVRKAWDGRPEGLDAALLVLTDGDAPRWRAAQPLRRRIYEHAPWVGEGYPEAAEEPRPNGVQAKPLAIWGTVPLPPREWQPPGELESWQLHIETAVRHREKWRGASGAPLFVHGRLAGLLRAFPEEVLNVHEAVALSWLFASTSFCRETGLLVREKDISAMRGRAVTRLKRAVKAAPALARRIVDVTEPHEELRDEQIDGPRRGQGRDSPLKGASPAPEDVVDAALDLRMVEWMKACNWAHSDLCEVEAFDAAQAIFDLVNLLLPSIVAKDLMFELASSDGAVLALPAGNMTVAEALVAAKHRMRAAYEVKLDKGDPWLERRVHGVALDPGDQDLVMARVRAVHRELWERMTPEERHGAKGEQAQAERINEWLRGLRDDQTEEDRTVYWYAYRAGDAESERVADKLMKRLSGDEWRSQRTVTRAVPELCLCRLDGDGGGDNLRVVVQLKKIIERARRFENLPQNQR